MYVEERDYLLSAERDVEQVLYRYLQEYQQSLIERRFRLDSTTATPQDLQRQFAAQMEPHLTDFDRERIEAHR